MSSTQEQPLDLSALADTYDIVGQLSSRDTTRHYAGRRRSDSQDVLITVMRARADVAEGKAIAQFAADANLLATLSHPNVPQVLEGRWVGEDAFALISEKVQGTTLAELLKGDRLTNPRVADILGDVDGVLEWARGERLSHRNVTPDGIWVERGTGKVWVQLSPTDAPKTNRPDSRDDARTLGTLALTMLTARPMAGDDSGTLADMRPDLPQRVVDVTEKVAACTINDEQPDIAAFLASIAMADAIKEGELEVARLDAEFRAQMKAEREKWEAEQQACQMANEAQARKFAEERAEYERRAAKEREQLESARGEVDKRRAEVQAARAELDQARAAYKQKKAELEARAKQVDKHMASLERQKRELEKRTQQLEARAAELQEQNRELQAMAALAAAGAAEAASASAGVTPTAAQMDDLLMRIKHADEINRTTQPVPVVADEFDDDAPQDDVEVVQEAVAAEEETHAWTPIETAEPWAVPLDTDEPVKAISFEAAAVPEPKKRGRPAWLIPAGIAGAVVLALGSAYAISRDDAPDAPRTVAAAPASASPAAPAVTSVLPAPTTTDSSAGTIVVSDSARFAAIRDSITAADAARAARARRAAQLAAEQAERRSAAQTVTDQNGVVWSTVAPPPISEVRRQDSLRRYNDSVSAAAVARRADSLARAQRDAFIRPDTGLARPRPDSIIRPPRPDTSIRVRPDTNRSGRSRVN